MINLSGGRDLRPGLSGGGSHIAPAMTLSRDQTLEGVRRFPVRASDGAKSAIAGVEADRQNRAGDPSKNAIAAYSNLAQREAKLDQDRRITT
jgi:hypothetical protein